jgi:hypothetical protein
VARLEWSSSEETEEEEEDLRGKETAVAAGQ